MTVVPAHARRVTTTPNATMTTLASPTQGGAALSVWLVEMGPDAAGPRHAFDCELVWTVLDGGGRLMLASGSIALAPGHTVILAADEMRTVHAGPEGMRAVVATAGRGRVVRESGEDAGVPEWVA